MNAMRLGLAIAALALLVVDMAAAQTIRGKVLDDATGAPIGDVTINVLEPSGATMASARTNTTGDFLLTLPRAGQILLYVQHIAYQSLLSDTLRLENNEVVQFEIGLAQNVIPLDPIVVVSRSTSDAQEFRDRQEHRAGTARFITREQIDSYRGSRVTDLLRTIPGVRIVPVASEAGSANRYFVAMTNDAAAVGGCNPTIYVDGVEVYQDIYTGLDDIISVQDLEGVEVYTWTSAPPALRPRGQCGVIAFWTRDPAGGEGGFSWRKLLGGLAAVTAVTLLLR